MVDKKMPSVKIRRELKLFKPKVLRVQTDTLAPPVIK